MTTNKNKADELISESHNVMNQKKELEHLQNKYNHILKKYEEAVENLNNATRTYAGVANTGDPNSYTNSNIFVNQMHSPPYSTSASYVAAAVNTGNITPLSGTYNYDSCKYAASYGQGNVFFALTGAKDGDPNSAQCLLSNNVDELTAGGLYQNSCTVDQTDGKTYGGAYVNSIYSVGGDGTTTTYEGCYKDQPERAMIPSGPDLDSMPSVFLCGDYGTSVWGTNSFPDSTAKWIWYTENAQSGAPVNVNSPCSFVYNYVLEENEYYMSNLYVMVDDYCEVYLNSNQIGVVSGGWGTIGQEPTVIPVNLATGSNYIVISAMNGGGPAGLCVCCIRQGNNQLLFHTDEAWKFTFDPPSSLVPPLSNIYSHDTCRDAAVKRGYRYFGLQYGSANTSQCFLSNDLEEAKKYGSAANLFTNGQNKYGGDGVLAIYNVETPPPDTYPMGKVARIDEKGNLTEYPSEMLQINKTNKYTAYPTVDNPSAANLVEPIQLSQQDCEKSCHDNEECRAYVYDTEQSMCYLKGKDAYPKTPVVFSPTKQLYYSPYTVTGDKSCATPVKNMPLDQWYNYENTGKLMEEGAMCGFQANVYDQEMEVKRLKKKLVDVTNTLVEKIKYLGNTNEDLLEQIGIDKRDFAKNLQEYNRVLLQTEKSVMVEKNQDDIVNLTTMNANMWNYRRILWIIIAVIILIVLYYTIKSMA